MTPLRRLVYVSRAVPAGPPLVARLARFSANNERDQITGVLLCVGNRFLQYLEGPPRAVGDCFARISLDPTHDSIAILLDEMAAVRAYPDCSMRLLPHADDHLDRCRRLVDAIARHRVDAGVQAVELLCDAAAQRRAVAVPPTPVVPLG